MPYYFLLAQPCAFNTLSLEAGYCFNASIGRIGRLTKLPEQLGQIKLKTFSVQLAQKVHSKVQMNASSVEGGKSLSQHSQLGFKINIVASLK